MHSDRINCCSIAFGYHKDKLNLIGSHKAKLIVGSLLLGSDIEIVARKNVAMWGWYEPSSPTDVACCEEGRSSFCGRCMFKSSADLWDDEVTVLGLTENMRVQKYINAYPDDRDFHSELRQFKKWLLDLGDGKASVSEKHDDIVEIPMLDSKASY